MPKPAYMIAVSVLGMGPAPGEIDACRTDPQGWVLNQIENPAKLTRNMREAPSLVDIMGFSRQIRKQRKKIKSAGKMIDKNVDNFGFAGDRFHKDIYLRHEQAIKTSTSFCERWFRFWCNRFTVSARNIYLRMTTGSFEREAIRPHIFGKFEDLLQASTLHPAMLQYLDNSRSIGPNSRRGRRKNSNINENLAREVLELHTLGIDGGYNLADIQGLAKALTGWRHSGPPKTPDKIFEIDCHEPGSVKILGQSFVDEGQEQIVSVLKALARHESTARHIAIQIVKHFIPGDQHQNVIDDLAASFLKTGGDLKSLAIELVKHDALWRHEDYVFKTPDEYLVSMGRAFPDWDAHYSHVLPKLLGQPVLLAPSPEGWEQTGETWVNAENILIRLGSIRRTIDSLPSWITTEMFLADCFGGHLSKQTAKAIKAEPSRESKILVALMSPEFLRR